MASDSLHSNYVYKYILTFFSPKLHNFLLLSLIYLFLIIKTIDHKFIFSCLHKKSIRGFQSPIKYSVQFCWLNLEKDVIAGKKTPKEIGNQNCQRAWIPSLWEKHRTPRLVKRSLRWNMSKVCKILHGKQKEDKDNVGSLFCNH